MVRLVTSRWLEQFAAILTEIQRLNRLGRSANAANISIGHSYRVLLEPATESGYK